MQKLVEGVKIDANTLPYAGRILRTGAFAVDTAIMYLISLALRLGFDLNPTIQHTDTTTLLVAVGPLAVVMFVLHLAYETFFVGKYGATPGKMVFKLKVVNAEGGPVTYLRALSRRLTKILSEYILMIGCLMAFFDDERRALHDRICNTRVITTKPKV